jgi:hypothetical protein
VTVPLQLFTSALLTTQLSPIHQLLNSVKKAIPVILFLTKSRSFARESHMKKLSLIAALLFGVLLLQNCKRDTITAVANSSALLFAIINDTTFTPDTVQASITYNSAAKSKVFAVTGTYINQEVNIYATQNNSTNTPGFPLQTYNVNSTPDVAFSYYTKQKNPQGVFVFTQQGTVAPGSGTVTITAIDSVKKVITGTFSFTAVRNNYDMNGNIVSVYIAEVSQGAFNKLPYTFVSN